MCVGSRLRLSTLLVVMWAAGGETSTSTMDRTLRLRPRPFITTLMNLQQPVTSQDTVVTCGGQSTSRVTKWQNPGYPKLEQHLPGLCSLTVTPASDTCGLRVKFNDLPLTRASHHAHGGCHPCNSPSFKMSHSKGVTPTICAAVKGYEGILEVEPHSHKPLVLLLQLDPTHSSKFKITITTVACNDVHEHTSPNICGIKNQLTFAPQKPDEISHHHDATRDEDHSAHDESLTTEDDKALPHEGGQEEGEGGQEEGEAGQKEREARARGRVNKADARRRTLIKQLKKKDDLLSHSLALGIESGQVEVVGPRRQRHQLLQEPYVGEWPWMVVIQRKITVDFGRSKEHVAPCTGVLLDNDHVLTAASCLTTSDRSGWVMLEDLWALVGDHDYSKGDEAKSFKVAISKVAFPLVFDPKFAGHDLAVVTLATSVEYSHNIRPVCLPVDYNVFPKLEGVVAGWVDKKKYYGRKKTTLLTSKVRILDQRDCNDKISNLLWPQEHRKTKVNDSDFMCSASSYYSSPVCPFGPGVPLVRQDRTGAHYVLGVNSGTSTCGTDFPDLYSRLTAHKTFLNLSLMHGGGSFG